MISNYHDQESNAVWLSARTDCEIQIAASRSTCNCLERDDCEVTHLTSRVPKGVSTSFRWDVGLTKWIEDFAPDVIHYNGEMWSLGLRRCILTKIPTVAHVAETRLTQGGPISDCLRRKIAESNLQGISGVIGWSSHALEALELIGLQSSIPTAVFPAKTKVRSRGPKPPTVAPPKPIRAIYVGRLVEEKGIRTLIEAVEEAEKGTIQLAIAGEGPLASFIESRIAGSDVRLLGYLNSTEVEEEIRKADVLVLPSRDQGNVCEQFGLVLVEAMAQGTAILASDVCSIPEVVGRDGILVRPDDPGMLLEALSRLRLELGYLNSWQQKSASAYSRYAPDRLASRAVEIWQQAAMNT